MEKKEETERKGSFFVCVDSRYNECICNVVRSMMMHSK